MLHQIMVVADVLGTWEEVGGRNVKLVITCEICCSGESPH